MDEVESSRYWCYMCNQRVSPILEVEEAIKCPICQSGFIEEMGTAEAANADVAAAANATVTAASGNESPFDLGGSESDRALSLWAPILLGMMTNPHRRRRFRRLEFEDDYNDDEDNNEFIHHRRDHEAETELERELESALRMRRRSSANILQLLHGIRAGMTPSENSENDNTERERGDRERVILINPFNQTIIVQGSLDSTGNGNTQSLPIGSLGDYFVGPGLDLLLQHLTENDPNRYGTPPAQKEAVEALPTVNIEETSLQCSVCLDEFDIGAEAKEMPCKHKFHNGCILPWLELHSSCPVCRHQLPSDESKLVPGGPGNTNDGNNGDGSRREGEDGDGRNDNRGRFSLPLPWPFSSLFSSSGSQSGNGSSASTTSSEPSRNVPSSSSRTHED